MKTVSDVNRIDDAIPCPALANTRREVYQPRPAHHNTGPRSFEHALTSAWYMAARRGFTPGREDEYLLESTFRQADQRTS